MCGPSRTLTMMRVTADTHKAMTGVTQGVTHVQIRKDQHKEYIKIGPNIGFWGSVSHIDLVHPNCPRSGTWGRQRVQQACFAC